MMKSPLSTRPHWARGGDDSGAAMITALLAILVTAMFAIVMLGVILSQVMPTQLQQATTRTVFAAEAGVNVVVGQIRSAEAPPDGVGNIYGDTKKLPCTSQGTVGSGSSALMYKATIQYFTENPTTQDDAWRASHALACSPGAGPSAAPTHALILSSGTGLVVQNAPGDLDRTIEVVYAFQIAITNIPGGFIKTYNGKDPLAAPKYCLEATDLAVGANVKYVNAADCVEGNEKQFWVYDKDYTIKLAVSMVPTSGLPALCITGDPKSSGPTKVTLQECSKATDESIHNQFWSWAGNRTWEGENGPLSNLTKSGYFLDSGTNGSVGAGSFLQLTYNGSGGTDEWASFSPDPRVGAGPAGKKKSQIVNFQSGGSCADVTDEVWNNEQMILFPCKQDPNLNQNELLWNHKWYYDEPTTGFGSIATQIKVQDTDHGGTWYCLTSVDAEGGFVTFKGCSAASTGQKWTRVAEMMGSYGDSYLFKDGFGRCLDVGPWYHTSIKSMTYFTMVTNACSPSLGQKWNALAYAGSASVGGYWELP